ncbi:hypothetical protein G6F24_014415 [Rhizopus arrhizus]|nr:hypothetical protein G6F24_014415 [Rhizopus arrhizus]
MPMPAPIPPPPPPPPARPPLASPALRPVPLAPGRRFAHEVTQRDHQVVGVHRPTLCQFVGGARGQPHLFVGAQQQDVRQCRLDRIADAAGAVRTRFGDAFGIFALAQVAAMAGVHPQFAGERTAQGLVGGHQRAQPLIDLPVLARAALLDGLHHQPADAHADQRDQRQAQQWRQQALPGTEIQITHAMGSRVASTAGQSRRQTRDTGSGSACHCGARCTSRPAARSSCIAQADPSATPSPSPAALRSAC